MYQSIGQAVDLVIDVRGIVKGVYKMGETANTVAHQKFDYEISLGRSSNGVNIWQYNPAWQAEFDRIYRSGSREAMENFALLVHDIGHMMFGAFGNPQPSSSVGESIVRSDCWEAGVSWNVTWSELDGISLSSSYYEQDSVTGDYRSFQSSWGRNPAPLFEVGNETPGGIEINIDN